MRYRSRSALFGFAIAAFAALNSASAQSGRVQPTPTPTPQDDTLRIRTEEIKLNVLAFDEHGAFFRDVTDKDIIISEDNVLHVPSSVRRVPANVLVIMDTGGELRAVKSLKRTQKIANILISALRPGDSVAVMTYADKPEIVTEWTSDKAEMAAAINRANFGKRSAFVQALDAAYKFLTKSGLDNKHIVLISDGTDSTQGGSAKFDAMERLLTTDVSIHVLSYSTLEAQDIAPRTKGTSNIPPPKALPPEVEAQLPNGVRPPGAKVGPTISLDRKLINKMKDRKLDLEISERQLERLSEDSNGEFILPTTVEEMEDKAPLVARMIDSTYVVTYVPKIPVVETRGIAERKIEVTSKRDGLIVQARRKLMIASGKQ